ncbi:AAA domain-containing protein [Thiohalocapsa marina]|uniref:AAA domain-containing protein n=1 Tax=Thiohalocapsa marina TaxID=424902 RepID=A0A5M8FBD2_9GAMM|nr:sigma-54-dependent Fis family transcriptional regulator [Thiohalocapsa marina]KAA6182188.1 AAA domain-containing protein [Thiohalocapsa marina]
MGGDKVPVLSRDRAEIDELRFPELTDLLGQLRFSTADGRIMLGEQRMMLLHAAAFGTLRREIIELFGEDVARGLFTRMGYQAGMLDARMARAIRSSATLEEMFAVGPQMHCLEGIGLSQPVRLEFDIEKGTHYGEFIWTHPLEDEEHLRFFPIGDQPSCWMQIGYASGYSSEFMGKPILYREVECMAMSQPACRIIGKPVEEWGEEGARDMAFLMPTEQRRHAPGMTEPAVVSVAPPEQEPADDDSPVGLSPGFQSVMHMVRKAAPTNATVLFLGESGVGKEVFAQALHRMSSRSDKPFVAVNCAAIPEQLIESELFGCVRGAYTGATQNRAGRFERADGGTLFLDEIGTLSPGAQGNLLRALQEGEIERLGDTQSRSVDVRLIAATNVDLREEVLAGRFREDLFFRLNVFPIRVPPLRERRDDVPLLVARFLRKFNRVHNRHLTGFTQRAIDAIMAYDWPGNVRELENVIERGVILASDNSAIDAAQLFTSGEKFDTPQYAIGPAGQFEPRDPSQLLEDQLPDHEGERAFRCINNLLRGTHDSKDRISFDEIETVLLKKALDCADGNVAAAARLLGMTRPQMVYRLKSRGILEQRNR